MSSINMMHVNQVQSCVCHATVLADAQDAHLRPGSASARVTGIINNKHFLKVTYSIFKSYTDIYTLSPPKNQNIREPLKHDV